MTTNQLRNEALVTIAFSTFKVEKSLYDSLFTKTASDVREEANRKIYEKNRETIENIKRSIQFTIINLDYDLYPHPSY